MLERLVELSARTLGADRTSVWLQDPGDGDLVAHALWGYEESESRIKQLHFPLEVAQRFLALDDPFVLGPDEVTMIEGAPPSATSPSLSLRFISTAARRAASSASAPPVTSSRASGA